MLGLSLATSVVDALVWEEVSQLELLTLGHPAYSIPYYLAVEHCHCWK